MIGYTTVGTNDLARATAFYDALFGELDIRRIMDLGRGHMWGVTMGKPAFAVMLPYDGHAAAPGNGCMVGLAVDSKDKVDRVHRKALELGGKDEGPVGARGPGFYAGYFRDLDGNKLNVFHAG